MSERLRCTYCGGWLSAVECVRRENLTLRRFVGWHPRCHIKDALTNAPWTELLEKVEARGQGRVGEIGQAAE